MDIRLQQELLNLAGLPVTIDGQDGPQTQAAMRVLDARRPLRLLADYSPHPCPSLPQEILTLGAAVLYVAHWYRVQPWAREVGGDNMGPFVRWCVGSEGPKSAWCAGFAAGRVLGEAEVLVNMGRAAAGRVPYYVAARYDSPWCPTLYVRAAHGGRLVTDPAQAKPGMLVLFLRHPGIVDSCYHVGVSEAVDLPTGWYATVEGNSPDASDRGVRDRVAGHLRRLDAPGVSLAWVSLD